MSQTKGYIYLRDNRWFTMENVIKMGVSQDIKNRNTTYITSEPIPGEFIYVIEIPIDKLPLIDRCLKNYFKRHHTYKRGGGTEYYDRCIINLLEPYIRKTNIEYRVLSKDEIDLMHRCERPRKSSKNLLSSSMIQKAIERYKYKRFNKGLTTCNKPTNGILNTIKPHKHQQNVLDIIEGFYDSHDIGKIVWACGLGKALLSVLIVDLLKFRTVLFGVPSKTLQQQIKAEILKLFPTKNNILCIGGDNRYDIESTTDKNTLSRFLNSHNNSQPKFVISTYHSCHLLLDTDIVFDFKIGDEAHHLVGIEGEETRGFRLFHKINSLKTLYMTATEKTIETRTYKEIYSMDDEAIFGKTIDVKSVHWAIENGRITDYNILVIKNTKDDIDIIINSLKLNITNKDLFISCYMCLKSLDIYTDLTHVLIYANTTEDAELCKSYIDELLKLNIVAISKNDIYNNALHSRNSHDLEGEINKFKNTQYGIISCVYIFGEGFDLPKLNGVCIAGNMQSETRIVQYLLRPNRLDGDKPNKKAYVIIPYIDDDDWETEGSSYKRVRTIVSQMRNVDENIEQKIVVSVGKRDTKERTLREETQQYDDYVLDENCDELSKIKLRLRYSKALGSKFTEEQDEYYYVCSLNASLNIQSKKDYNEIKENHIHFIERPEEYFKAKGVWNNWYDFMGVDTTKFIQSKQDWISFCNEKCIKSLDCYYSACDENDVLPKEPADFYNDFTNIPNELGFNRNRRR